MGSFFKKKVEKSFCYKKIKITLREKRMVKLAMYSLLIVITFFGVGAFSGKLFVKFPDREQREEKLMWIFLTFLMMYFASGFCIQMITGHKGFSLSLV